MSRVCRNRISQHHPNNNFRVCRGLDGLQKIKLRTHEEDKSDIGARETRENASDVQG